MLTQLDPLDVDRAVRRLPLSLVELLKKQGLIVAGGYVRTIVASERTSDIDVFATSKDQAIASAKEFADATHTRTVETVNAITVLTKTPVQFIHRWSYGSSADLLASFDFSIARAALRWVGGGWAGVCDDRFYCDLAARRIVFMNPVDNTAGGSLLRLLKFTRRGYHVSAFQLAAVVAALMKSANSDPLVVGAAIEMIREVDPSAWRAVQQDAPAVAAAAVVDSDDRDDDILF